MGLYNFQARFVPFIRSGEKKHTIRAVRAHPDKPGNVLYLYTGLRTKEAKLIKRVECVKVETIEIHGYSPTESGEVIIEGVTLSNDEREAFALRDGFQPSAVAKGRGQLTAWANMLFFWDGRLPFKGQIIHWK